MFIKQINRLKTTYTAYIESSPNDDKTKTAMAYIFYSLGEFKNAWITTNTINDNFLAKQELKKSLNKDVLYVSLDLKNYLNQKNWKMFYWLPKRIMITLLPGYF